MSTEWKIVLEIQSNTYENTKSLSSSLITDWEVSNNQDSFSFEIIENKAKDLRAMWNTRIRGLIAVDSLMTTIDEFDLGED